MEKQKSYLVDSMTRAICEGSEAGNNVLCDGMRAVSSDLVGVINSYNKKDLPLILASMRILIDGTLSALPEPAKRLYQQLNESFACITIKATASPGESSFVEVETL